MVISSLVFVYRTDANPVSVLAEFARDNFGTDAHQCNLCHLTYGRLFKRREWNAFMAQLPVPSSFHLRSRFLARHGSWTGEDFPVIFASDDDGALEVFLSAAELATALTLDQLMTMITDRLAQRTVR